MLIVYDTFTGNVQRFVDKLGMRNVRVRKDLVINEPFILITYTIRFGEVPKSTEQFLEVNREFLRGVASSGNRNWGDLFAQAATTISYKYKVPLLHQFELSGNDKDVWTLNERLREIERS